MAVSLPRARLIVSVLGLSLLGLAAAGCVHYHGTHHSRVYRTSHPPWAPAHGYRHHHEGVVLVFDSGLDCYVVPGHTYHYFHGDHYYRHHHGRWETAPRLRGPWVPAGARALPPGVRRRHARGDLRHHPVRVRHREHPREAAKERHAHGRRGEKADGGDHREERQAALRERREERREVVRERREERRKVVREHREERREAVRERREEQREAVREHREAQRDSARERRHERLELAQRRREKRLGERAAAKRRAK